MFGTAAVLLIVWLGTDRNSLQSANISLDKEASLVTNETEERHGIQRVHGETAKDEFERVQQLCFAMLCFMLHQHNQ